MSFKELVLRLSNLGLIIEEGLDGYLVIASKEFANPLLFFDPESEYHGSVFVKAINASLYTPEQISEALSLVDKYLRYRHNSY